MVVGRQESASRDFADASAGAADLARLHSSRLCAPHHIKLTGAANARASIKASHQPLQAMADWAPLPPLPWLPYAPLAGAALLAARAADIGRRFGSTARHGLLAPLVTEADVAAQRDGLHAHGALPGRAYTADDFGRRGEREQRHRVLLLEALALVEVLVWTFVASMQYASSEVDAASAPAVSAAATWVSDTGLQHQRLPDALHSSLSVF